MQGGIYLTGVVVLCIGGYFLYGLLDAAVQRAQDNFAKKVAGLVKEKPSKVSGLTGASNKELPTETGEPSQKSTPPKIPHKPKKALTTLTDGQRFALQKKLVAYAGKTVRLVRIRNDPKNGIAFEQLTTVFSESNWTVQQGIVGTVSITGLTFPGNPYLTGTNINNDTIKAVFSIFAGVGIDLPLTPDAYTGPASMGAVPEVVIVIH